MKTRLATLALAAFLLCSGFICTGSQIHNVNVANTDLATALNKAAKETIDLNAQGIITLGEQQAILPHITAATIVSDKINDCTTAANAASTLKGCVAPLLMAVRDDIDAAALGIKSPNAQAVLKVSLDGALAIVTKIASAGGN